MLVFDKVAINIGNALEKAMHPINNRHFGIHGLAVQYYNGTSVVPGYIVRQTGTKRFVVTDGSHPATVLLAPTTAIATALATVGNQGYCTMLVVPPVSGSGATFTPSFGIDTAVVAGGGTGYTVGDTLHLTGVTGGTLAVATVSTGVITGVTVSAVGGTASLVASPVSVTGGTGAGATFTVKYKLLAITSTGGSGYSVGESLSFAGMTADTLPTAHVATITSGAATTVTVDTAGSGITVAGAGPGAGSGATQHASNLEEFVLWTTEGNKLSWTVGLSVNGSAYIATFS
jgi:hypothetical protein